jgi:hypothetical protein
MARDGSRKRRVAAVLALLVLIAGLGWSFYASCRHDAQPDGADPPDPTAQPRRVVPEPGREIRGGFEISGQVCDSEGRPLDKVTLLIIRKTWPGGQFYQHAFTATTDTEGRFAVPRLLPTNYKYNVQVTALKEGFAFQSVYQSMDDLPVDGPQPVSMRLETADKFTLVVRDTDGQAVANAEVIPSTRTPPGSVDQHVYLQGSDKVTKRTDDRGRVQLNWFRAGDQAEVFLKYPRVALQRSKFVLETAGSMIELAVEPSPPAVPVPRLVIMLGVGCAGVCLFYFWLIVRVINRRERWTKRTLAALTFVALLLAYPASIGPVVWLYSRGYISQSTYEAYSEPCGRTIWSVVGFVCKPFSERTHAWAYYLVNNYVQAWLPEPSYQWPVFED